MALPKFVINKRLILIMVGVVLFIELAWAFWALSKVTPKAIVSKTTKPAITTPSQTPLTTKASISLQGPLSSVKVGEKITVTVNEAAQRMTDGTDLVILYDPKLLSVVKTNNIPFTPGLIYSDYPLNTVDAQKGRVAVSGITYKEGGVTPQGIFGSIVFQAKVAGRTTVAVEFVPGSTIDSNIIETKTAKDILSEVRNLDLNILP